MRLDGIPWRPLPLDPLAAITQDLVSGDPYRITGALHRLRALETHLLVAWLRVQAQDQVRELVRSIRANGSQAKIVWVGPSKTAADMRDGGASLRAFDRKIAAALAGEGVYISSEPRTAYSGGDGIHYRAEAARAWARAVFQAAQNM